MYIGELVRYLSEKLSNEFGIPVSVELFNRESSDTYLRIYEKQSGLFIGFNVCLSWRKMSLSFSPRYVITNSYAYSVWMENLEMNRGAFDLYCKRLREKTIKLSFHINQDTTNDVQIVEDCYFFSVEAISGFLEVRDNLVFYSETILPILIDFWGLILSFTGVYETDELPKEGKKQTVVSKRYERNGLYRKLCIEHYGCFCQICGENLEDKYGSVASGLIEVHHIEPVSEYEKPKVINPIADLLPVCPNCHAVLHRRKPAYLPEEVKAMLEGEKNV